MNISTSPRDHASVNWRRNLAVLWLAQFTSIFGFSFALPFLSIFLQDDLGVGGASNLAFWTGLSWGASGLGQALLSPFWGILADRIGRKPMLIRAMVGGGLAVATMAFARGPAELVALRAVQGLFAGTTPAATTIVAAGTPRGRVGWAMGIISSAIALGGAVGPMAGGFASALIGVRYIFFGGGVALLLGVIPVALAVEETPRVPSAGVAGLRTVVRAAEPGTGRAILVLLLTQMLLFVAWAGSQPLFTLKLIQVAPADAAALTGIAFGAFGLASALGAIGYPWAAERIGFRLLIEIASALAGATLLTIAVAQTAAILVATIFICGLCFGVVGPAVAAMLGLEIPVGVQGQVFGLSSTAMALGIGLGPFLGGTLAALTSVATALFSIGAVSVLLGTVVGLYAREPAK